MRCAYFYAFVRYYHVYEMSLYSSIKNFTIEVNPIEVVLVDTIYTLIHQRVAKILRFLVPKLTYLRKKSFLLYFVRHCVDQLYIPNFCGFVSVMEMQYIHAQRCWVGSGGGDVKFLLKCHTLCVICLTSFVVHKSPPSI